MVRKLVNFLLKPSRLMVVPDWRAVQLDEERHLRRLLSYLDVDCIFDVGANIGQYASMLRKYVGYKGTIISFEPNPVAFAKLKTEAANDPKWHVEQLALGDRAGILEFQAYDRSELGSFRKFGNSKNAPTSMTANTIEISVQTLGSYYGMAREKFRFRRPFLKLDTQGFDLEVARGAGKGLYDFVGLQSEIAFQPIYEGAPDYATSLNFFRSAGFVISRIVPIHEVHFPELVEMDVIMIRDDLVNASGK